MKASEIFNLLDAIQENFVKVSSAKKKQKPFVPEHFHIRERKKQAADINHRVCVSETK